MIKNWMKKDLVSDNNCNIVMYYAQIFLPEWQRLLGFQLVLVTLHVRIAISIFLQGK
jgi:hypothetical protein